MLKFWILKVNNGYLYEMERVVLIIELLNNYILEI